MRKVTGVVAALAVGAFGVVFAANNDPVMLINGYGGDASTFQYRDVIENEGITTFVPVVHRLTSNRNRVAEIYAQMKGTVVDYGYCHTQGTKHIRFGKDYTGKALFPEWDENHKIHLWGYSYGGSTATALERMLREGSGCPQDTSPLFAGGHNWVTSVTTFGGTFSGTTIVDLVGGNDLITKLRKLLVPFAGPLSSTVLQLLLQVELSEWGLEQQDGESFDDFWKRIEASGVLDASNTDTAMYDISIKGAREANAEGPLEYGDTYYFAFAMERTHAKTHCKYVFFDCVHVEEPDDEMTSYLKPLAKLIGENSADFLRKNDGSVNWVNQFCPIVDESDRDRCQEFDGSNWPIGQWVYQKITNRDHLQIWKKNRYDDIFHYSKSGKKMFKDHSRRTKGL